MVNYTYHSYHYSERMPKKGFTNCPECGAEVSKDKLTKHIRKVHPKQASDHGVIEPKRSKTAKFMSARKVERLEFQRAKEQKKNVTIVAVVALVIVAVIVVGYYRDTIIPKKHEPVAVIKTSLGTIKIKLYKDKVPNTVDNFEKYAKARFYNGLIFHRIANLDASRPTTHIVQGGGFDADLNSKTALYSPIELEIDDSLTHVDGAVAMARTDDPNSATSQFYICDGEQHFLDDATRQSQSGSRGYAVFGQVTSGWDVLRAIANHPVSTQGGNENVPNDPKPTIEQVTIE
jgi:cyclophilin family peptidyl-prolyl cis-trans isomerase